MRSDEIPTIGQVQLDVTGLGRLTGISLDNKACQYLGVPYADIPGRFRRSVEAAAPWPDSKWDGTKFGPYCPQPPRDFYPVPSPSRPWLEMPAANELNCLNLNISVPCLPADAASRPPMPVMVFVHGGAFAYSMNSSPVYDGRLLAAASADNVARPTIIVTVGYRLGVYGFLAGNDLAAHGRAHGDDSVGNYGVWDQVLALRWVQRHIAAFGGDPARVTLFGQSAGGVSTHCHLLRGEPLFSSAILQSGLVRTCGVLSVDQFQGVYERLLRELGISLDLPPSERVKQLLAVSEADLTAAMAKVFIIPVVTMPLCDDGVLVPARTDAKPEPESGSKSETKSLPSYADYARFDVPSWCPRIMMGDAKHEGIIWNKSWADLADEPMVKGQDLSVPTAARTLAKMQAFLGADKAAQVAELYGIAPDTPPDELFWALERLTTDGIFSLPIYFAELAAPASPDAASVLAYHFDVPSPYENAWGGRAHHSHDNVLVWGVLKHTLPPAQQRVSEQMVDAWIRFAHGEDPWPRRLPTDGTSSGSWMVFNEEGATLKTKDENQSRSYGTWDELHARGLVQAVCELSDELCLRTSDLVGGK